VAELCSPSYFAERDSPRMNERTEYVGYHARDSKQISGKNQSEKIIKVGTNFQHIK
jgi:hypothetical protein